MLRTLLLLVVLLTGCRSPVEVHASHAFVRRSESSADTIRVRRADTLRVEVRIDVQSGRATWALEDPAQQTVWSGVAADDDTVATVALPAPTAGDWRLVLTPDSAIGVAMVRAMAE